jgi:hypothetical protein
VGPVDQPGIEQAVISVEIAITRADDGTFLARLSFDDEPGWLTSVGADPASAFARASRTAYRRLRIPLDNADYPGQRGPP